MRPDSSRVELLRGKIREIVGTSPTILGSKLGFALSSAVPGFDVKREFGKLDHFIETYCSDLLSRSPQEGGHVVYVNRAEIGETSIAPALGPTVWQAFTNPANDAQLYLDRSGPVLVASTEAKDGDLIQKLTDTDHKAIAADFFSEASDNWKPLLQPAVDQQYEWSAWRRAIGSDKRLVRAWTRFRITRIEQVLAERLTSQGVDPEDTTRLTSQLVASRATRIDGDRNANEQRPSHSSTERSSKFRERFKLAIDAMSDAELGQVWLPASVLLNGNL